MKYVLVLSVFKDVLKLSTPVWVFHSFCNVVFSLQHNNKKYWMWLKTQDSLSSCNNSSYASKNSGIKSQNLVQIWIRLLQHVAHLPSEFSFPSLYNGNITPLPIWWIYGEGQVRQNYGRTWFIMKPDVPHVLFPIKWHKVPLWRVTVLPVCPNPFCRPK